MQHEFEEGFIFQLIVCCPIFLKLLTDYLDYFSLFGNLWRSSKAVDYFKLITLLMNYHNWNTLFPFVGHFVFLLIKKLWQCHLHMLPCCWVKSFWMSVKRVCFLLMVPELLIDFFITNLNQVRKSMCRIKQVLTERAIDEPDPRRSVEMKRMINAL